MSYTPNIWNNNDLVTATKMIHIEQGIQDLDNMVNPVTITHGGTGATTPADARANLEITPANIGAKSTQTAVADPTASGTAVAFIDGITQNANGIITPTKKTVRSASQSESGLMSATDKAKLDGIATGAQVNSITGVKGDAESSYRTGNVNLTAVNIGAVKNGGNVTTADLDENSVRYLNEDSSNSGVSHGTLFTMTNGNGRRSQLFIQSSDTSSPIKVRTYYNGWQPWRTVYKDNTTVPVTAGGTGATTPAAARTNLEITPENIGAVPVNGSIFMTNQNVDLTKANNNINADIWMPHISWTDKNSKQLVIIQGVAKTNGQTQLYLGVRNFNTDGNQATNKGISLVADKNGNLLYSFADPQNARSALGITPANIGAVSKSGDTMTGGLTIKTTSLDNSVTPSSDQYIDSLVIQDKNSKRMSLIRHWRKSDGSNGLQIGVIHEVSSTKMNNITLLVDSAGNQTYTVSNPANFCSAINAVSKSGDTMIGNLTINNQQPQVNLKNNTYVSGQNPSSTLWNVAANSYDKNSLRVGLIHQCFGTDGSSTWEINLQKRVNNTDYYGGFRITGSMTSTSSNKLIYNVDNKTLTGGIWQGNAIGVEYGGTGATTPAAARNNLEVKKISRTIAVIPSGSRSVDKTFDTNVTIIGVNAVAADGFVCWARINGNFSWRFYYSKYEVFSPASADITIDILYVEGII